MALQEAARLLDKTVNVYVKYAGDWYLPTEEADIANTLVDQYKVDVITQQTDSGSPLDVATNKGIWFVGKDMDTLGEYGWGSLDTVAVSFDTRWEVLYEKIVKSYLAGEQNPETVLYMGMKDKMTLADGTEEYTVDLMNDGKVGIDAISPKSSAPHPAGDRRSRRPETKPDDRWRVGPVLRARLRQQWHWPGAGRTADPGQGNGSQAGRPDADG